MQCQDSDFTSSQKVKKEEFKDTFLLWAEIEWLWKQYGGPVVMVVDNTPCHSNIEEVFSEEEFLGWEVLRLGPYSPMFNPIELVRSLIKAYIKQELAAKIVSILAMERRDGLSITEQKARALPSLIEKELGRITPEVCNRFIARIQSNFFF